MAISPLGHIFNGANAHGGQGKWNAKFFGCAGRQNFTIGVLHAGETCGCNGHRHGHLLTNHGGGRAAALHVHSHTLAQFDFLKIALVGAVSAFCPRTAVGIVIEHARHTFLGQDAQFFDGGDHGHIRFPIWIEA